MVTCIGKLKQILKDWLDDYPNEIILQEEQKNVIVFMESRFGSPEFVKTLEAFPSTAFVSLSVRLFPPLEGSPESIALFLHKLLQLSGISGIKFHEPLLSDVLPTTTPDLAATVEFKCNTSNIKDLERELIEALTELGILEDEYEDTGLSLYDWLRDYAFRVLGLRPKGDSE
jgi:hypothetical protein